MSTPTETQAIMTDLDKPGTERRRPFGRWLRETGVRTAPLRVVVVLLACYSIAAGFMLGFNGRNGCFKRLNPERFEAVRRMVE